MIKKESYTKEELLSNSEGILNGLENGKLPQPPMLMIDRILKIVNSFLFLPTLFWQKKPLDL